MKKLKLSVLALFCSIVSLNAQDLPAPSPYGEVTQRVGLTDVTVQYSRPGVKGRTIFGGLEAYGEIWRTGANAATKIVLSTDATIGDVKVPAGTYSILSVPGKEEWKVVLNKDLKVTENSYNADENIAEIAVKPMENAMTETMMFSFHNVKENSADLVFEWENTSWALPIKVEVEAQAMENIKNEISKLENAYGVYNSSARYYLEHDKDLDQALAWSKKSVSISPQFWNVYTLSLIQHAKGDKKAAIATAERSMKLAEEAGYAPYIQRNKDNIEKWKKEGNK
jgi:tetratricopeptide (TPR) repeat protein